MKAGCYTQVFILGLFLGLLCSVISSELPSQNRILDSVPSHQYKFERETTDSDGHHIFASYKGSQGYFGSSEIVKNIEMIVSFQDKNTFRIKIKDANNKRWEIPEKAPFPHFQPDKTISEAESNCEVHIEHDPFYFYITRKGTNQILFDTRNKDFLFSDLYIQLSSSLPTENIYGFGERNYKFKLSPGVYSIWPRDDPMIRQDGNAGGNTYSHHPVGLIRGEDGKFFLTLMRNSNAMDVIIEKDNSNKYSLTYKIVGGIIDLIFFIGTESPEPVLKSYHNYLGNFTMMPFWSMGYHQSKWGYVNHATMNDVVSKYSEHDLPLDVIWSDLDYMYDKEIFTVDTAKFPPEKMKELKSKHNKKWVPLIDPGVRVDHPQGPGLREGQARDIFIKKHNGGDLRGYVWPGHVYFPDFFNPKTEQYWKDMLEVLYQIVPFSGIWLDMNEVANFVEGETPTRYDRNKYDQLPYTPGSHPLNHKTISLDAKHHGDLIEFDVHGLYSILESEATYNYLKTKSKLPFILTRGTSMGIGKFTAHWSGDNGAHWEYLQDSIPGNFNFQIYGIPFVGADICGFMDGTNAELCARWTQVGALYPFARNHHEERTRNQEPWTFHELNHGVSIIETTRASLKTRYAILKWYYSLFIETEGSGSIFRPLMFEFPSEAELYNDGFGDKQFLLGKGVMCTPKVEPGEPHVEAYFPQATWYELFTGKRFISKEASDRTKRVETPFNASVPMFLRGGHILHHQAVDRVLSTEDLNNEFELIVAVEKNEKDVLAAKGTMMGIENYDDDSVHDRCMQDNCLYDISVTVPREDVASVSVEISFKRQKQDVRTKLDGFGLFGLKLYGLPLDFMAEDESKIGYGLLEITDEKGEIFTNPDLVELLAIENNAFQIHFDTPLKIEDGTVLKLELLI